MNISVSNHPCWYFLISECQVIEVILRNNVLNTYGNYQGRYQIYPYQVNGKTSWKTGTHAIWFVPENDNWAIGILDSIGTEWNGMRSGDHQQWGHFDDLSFNYYQWKYHEYNPFVWWEWEGLWKVIPSGDITFNCISGKYSKFSIISTLCL